MDSDSLTPDPANQAIDHDAPPPDGRSVYIAPAPKIDVMFDQLEYLLGHQDDRCSAGCPDCMRLKQVEDSLLQPFRGAVMGHSATA